MPLTPRSDTFTTPALAGVRLHTLTWGVPRTRETNLVLLHGGGANAHWWDHIAPAFADRFCVTALDFRGHGESDYPEDFIPGAFNQDLDALLDHLGTREVVLVGHSMGARIATLHASQCHSTRALVLIDPARGGGRSPRRRNRLALAFARSYPTREDAMDRYQFLPESRHVERGLRDAIARHSVRELPNGRFAYRFDPRWFSVVPKRRSAGGEVRCPTLILRGGESEVLTREGARALESEIPHGQLVEVAGAGHHLHLDRPDETRRLLEAFFDAAVPDR